MWTKILAGIFLISVLGLSCVLYSQKTKQDAFEARIDRALERSLPYYKEASKGVFNALRSEAQAYSQFYPLEEKGFKIMDSTKHRLQLLDGNNVIQAIDYKMLLDNDRYFNDIVKTRDYFAIDSIQHKLKDSQLQKNILKTALNKNKLTTLNHLYGQTGIDCFSMRYNLASLTNSKAIQLGDTFKTQIQLLDNEPSEINFNKIYINGEPKRKLSLTPKTTGKYPYIVEIRNEKDSSIYKKEHFFFVENCKPTQNPSK